MEEYYEYIFNLANVLLSLRLAFALPYVAIAKIKRDTLIQHLEALII
jgi:hypothetical protein